MKTRTETIDDISMVAPQAKALDGTNAMGLKQEILKVIKQHPKLVLDMAQVEQIDSEGMAVILSCLKAAKEAGGEMVLCSLCHQVSQVCELILFNRVVDIFSSREDALTAFPRIDGKNNQVF